MTAPEIVAVSAMAAIYACVMGLRFAHFAAADRERSNRRGPVPEKEYPRDTPGAW